MHHAGINDARYADEVLYQRDINVGAGLFVGLAFIHVGHSRKVDDYLRLKLHYAVF
jgi:hypothetical protein